VGHTFVRSFKVMSSVTAKRFKLSYYREEKVSEEQLPEAVRNNRAVLSGIGQRFHLIKGIFSGAEIVGEEVLTELIDTPELSLPPGLSGHCFSLRVERDQRFDWYVFSAVNNQQLVLPSLPSVKVGHWEWRDVRLVGQSYADQFLSEPLANWLKTKELGVCLMTITSAGDLSQVGAPSHSVGTRWKGMLFAEVLSL
jgi:hypothetical protein